MSGITADGARVDAAAIEREADATIRALEARVHAAASPAERHDLETQIRTVREERTRKKTAIRLKARLEAA